MCVPAVVLVAVVYKEFIRECKFLKFAVSNIHCWWQASLLKWTLHGWGFCLIVPFGRRWDWNNCKLSWCRRSWGGWHVKNPSEKIIHGKLVENWPHYHDYSPPLCISPIFSTGFWTENVKLSWIKTQVTTTKQNPTTTRANNRPRLWRKYCRRRCHRGGGG